MVHIWLGKNIIIFSCFTFYLVTTEKHKFINRSHWIYEDSIVQVFNYFSNVTVYVFFLTYSTMLIVCMDDTLFHPVKKKDKHFMNPNINYRFCQM